MNDTTGRPESIVASSERNEKSGFAWLEKSVLIVGLFTTIFALLGYGVALAIEVTFSMPHAAVYESTFDLLDLSSIFFLEFLSGATLKLDAASIVGKLYAEEGSVIGCVTAIIIICYLGYRWKGQRLKERFTSNNGRAFKENIRANPAKYVAWTAVGLTAAHPLLVTIGVWLVIFFMTLLMLIPFMGMQAGIAGLREWVIAPHRCKPITDILTLQGKPKSKSQEIYATCVVVKKDDKIIASGRVAFMTSRSAILVGTNGQARKVPIAEAVVETVQELPSDTVSPQTVEKVVKSEK